MIPAEAVEAAAKIVGDLFLDDEDRDEWTRRILEAATPHILAAARAEAWDEGWDAGTLSQFTEPKNPYRPAT